MTTPSSQPWATLGTLQVELVTSPRSFRYRESNVWAKHPRIGLKPNIQLTGVDLQTLVMEFRFQHGWCNPDEELQKLQQLRIDAQPQSLILDKGRFQGYYVIQSVDVVLTNTAATGEILSLNVRVGMIETVDLPVAMVPTENQPFETRA